MDKETQALTTRSRLPEIELSEEVPTKVKILGLLAFLMALITAVVMGIWFGVQIHEGTEWVISAVRNFVRGLL